MLKDRAQKVLALKLSISKRWLPQLEIEIESSTRIEKSKYILTDIDVLTVSPSSIGGHTRLIFDCKSGARESAIGRAFWLHGVMAKTQSKHGFIVLNSKVSITHDHRISAAELGVTLLHEHEIENLAQCMGGSTVVGQTAIGDIDIWEQFLNISTKYPNLSTYHNFSRTGFWMLKDIGEQCRKTVARLRSIRTELDPTKVEHLAIFGDALCLFILTLSELANRLYLVLIRPTSKTEFSESLLALLYGGYENLEAAHKIRKLTALNLTSEDSLAIFPEIEKFENLVREILQAPQQVLPASILAREIGFSFLAGGEVTTLQVEIASESPYSAKYLLMAAEYLQKATRVPFEFSNYFANAALRLSVEVLKK